MSAYGNIFDRPPVTIVPPMSPAVYVAGNPDPPPSGGSAFDPVAKNAAIVLSNGNKTATLSNGGVQDVAGLATVAIPAGAKVRIEIQVTQTSDRVALGIGTAALLTSDSAFLGCVAGNGIGNYSS